MTAGGWEGGYDSLPAKQLINTANPETVTENNISLAHCSQGNIKALENYLSAKTKFVDLGFDNMMCGGGGDGSSKQ